MNTSSEHDPETVAIEVPGETETEATIATVIGFPVFGVFPGAVPVTPEVVRAALDDEP